MKKLGCGLLSFVLFLAVGNVGADDDDEFLKAIESEIHKFDEFGGIDIPGEDKPAQPAQEDEEARAIKLRAFESLLKSRHKGTYSIFETLESRDKAEIFEAFDKGASMREIKKMVIDRKMHR